MRVLFVAPGGDPEERDIDGTFENIKKLIGDGDGDLTAERRVILAKVAAYFDEDGLQKVLRPNRRLDGHTIVGNIVIVREVPSGGYESMREKDLKAARAVLRG